MDRAKILSEMGIDTWVRTESQEIAGTGVSSGNSKVHEPLSQESAQGGKLEPSQSDSASSNNGQLTAKEYSDLAEASPTTEVTNEPETVDSLEEVRAEVLACRQCSLCDTRTRAVPGLGDLSAKWMFIGTAPGVEEDRLGEPFVGRAGQLLDNIFRALDLARGDVYISSVLKCHPPGNRELQSKEIDSCRSYLFREIKMVQPDIIVALGDVVTRELLQNDLPSNKLRGKIHRLTSGDIPCVVTYHPNAVLREPTHKKHVWDDLMLARSVFEDRSETLA